MLKALDPTVHPRSGATPAIAALLSTLLPGLGQIAAGSTEQGILIAIPMVTAVAAAVGLVVGGGLRVLGSLVTPAAIVSLLVINAVLGLYRAWAIVDAERTAQRRHAVPRGRRSKVLVAVLVLATIGFHGAVEAVGIQAQDTLGAVFLPGGGDGQWTIPSPSFETAAPTTAPSTTPGPSAAATAVPTPTAGPGPAWAADGRLNILLIGGDAGPGRWSLRTDTMEILSVDVASGRAALFGLPRNLLNVPLPPESAGAVKNGLYPGLLNSLYVYASEHPDQFPGGDARGFRAVAGAIQQLIGVPLDGAVVVNLNGFVRLVDAIGGLWIQVPETIVDSHYPLENGRGDIVLVIKSGCRHLDGHLALGYARSRHMDSDYGRMGRQQSVLVALAKQVNPISILPRLSSLLSIAKDDLWTTFAVGDATPIGVLLATVHPNEIQQTTFVPPATPEFLDAKAVKAIQTEVRDVFSSTPTSSPSPAPTPGPTPAPSAAPGQCG